MRDGGANFVIETRQKADVLFSLALINPAPAGVGTPQAPRPVLLDAGGTYTSPVREVSGYGAIAFIILSDQPFQLHIQEASSADGPFVETSVISSALDAVTFLQKVTSRVIPSGSFMKIVVNNLGLKQTLFQLLGLGIPVTGSSTGGGGGAGASGFSGFIGTSGFSGFIGTSGFSGFSGISGFSGANPGASGFSGFSGGAGSNGASGASGFSGFSGESGTSGFSGSSGNGTSGFSGAGGTTWRDGTGAPSNALGVDGDYYLDNSTGDVYLRKAGVYAIVGNMSPTAGIFSDRFQPGAGTISAASPGPIEGWTYTFDLQAGGANASIIISPNSFNLHHNNVFAADYAAAKKSVLAQPASTDMKNTTLQFTWGRDNQIGPLGYGVNFSSANAVYVKISNVPAFSIVIGQTASVTRYTGSGALVNGVGPFKITLTIDSAGVPLLYVDGVNVVLTNQGAGVLPIGMVADQFYIEYNLNFGTVQDATVSSVFLANGVFSPLVTFT